MTLSALYRLPADSAPFSVWQHNKYMFTDHVDISQAFVQGELLPRDGHNGKVHIFSPPGYDEEILRTWNFWNATPRLTPMQPNTRLNKDDCDKRILPLISIDVIVVLSVA